MFSKTLILFVALGVSAIAGSPIEAFEENVAVNRPRYHVDILRLDSETDKLYHVCDGAILAGRFVLTAAHCVYDETVSHLRVRSGSDVAPPENMPHHEERLFHKVSKVMYPKDYVHTSCRHHEHDIAILKVGRSFDLAYDELYKQVNLPEPSNDYENYEALISGYSNDKLETINTNVLSNEECSKRASSIVTKGNICGNLDVATVQAHGDISGSPLVHDNTIIGIMNAQNKCSVEAPAGIKCAEQDPTLVLYTRVSAYLEFIEKVLNSQAATDIVYRS